ncbi:MAG: YhdH/YhfP family quinone oxidoreductase [Desulfobacterales bacterium]|nr:YhdH/YhfP family quinone oxidoreductase [Desulfobacterales bacterium]
MTEERTFKAIVVAEDENGRYTRSISKRSIQDLPAGEVLVQVRYSSLNYKDLLSATGNKGVTRKYPHTPGIDAAGLVVESSGGEFKAGDEVIVTSYDLGMNTDGGFGQYIRVPAAWVVPLPNGLSLRESMAYGTAGFTAGLSILRLMEHGIGPDDGNILVSGATGGVGSLSVSILSRLGYRVTAVSGRTDAADFLQSLGAAEVIGVKEASDDSGRPLLKGRWAGSVDTVGGEILATTLKSTHLHGAVACCGNVASAELPINVFPFILRGVTLYGIDSQNCPMPARRKVWERLAGEWKIDHAEGLVTEIGLQELDGAIQKMKERRHRGRTIVRLFDE